MNNEMSSADLSVFEKNTGQSFGQVEKTVFKPVENVPHRRIGDSDVFVDLRVERYAADGVTDEATKDKWNKAVGGFSAVSCYGEIPPGFTKFSDEGFPGDVLLYDGDKFSVRNKSDVILSGYEPLPEGWTKTVMVEKVGGDVQ